MVAKEVTFPEGIPAGLVVTMKSIVNLNIVVPDYGSITEDHFGDIEMYKNVTVINDHTVIEGNRFSAGPVEIADGAGVDLQGDSVWVIL